MKDLTNICEPKSAKVTSIFLHDKKSKDNINYFTRIIVNSSNSDDLLELETIYELSKGKTISIIEYQIHNIEIEHLRKDLLSGSLTYNGEKLHLGNLTLLDSVYVPTDAKYNNEELKAICGSTLITGKFIEELQCVEHNIYNQINRDFGEVNQLKVCKKIKAKCDIDLHYLFDKVGSVIIEFPVEKIALEMDEEKCRYEIKANNDFPPVDVFYYDPSSKLDTIRIESTESKHINFHRYAPNWQAMLKLKNTGEIAAVIKSCKFNPGRARPIEFRKSKRIRWGEVIDESILRIRRDNASEERIAHRRNRNKGRKAEQLGDFRQFDSNEKSENVDEFILFLIERYGVEGTFIWDPYLSYQFVERVLSKAKCYRRMKLLTSKKATKSYEGKELVAAEGGTQKLSIKELWVDECKKRLSNIRASPHWKIELRISSNVAYSDFHDRFILFPKGNENVSPLAWSLGKSLNHLKPSHFIIQRVLFPEKVLDLFIKLWNRLNNEENIIFKN